MSFDFEKFDQDISTVLEAPIVSVEDALVRAVLAGRMSIEESQQCLEAYEATFHPQG